MSLVSHHAKTRRRRNFSPLGLLLLALPLLLLLAHPGGARAQAIGAHRGDTAGTGGTRSIQGRILSASGKMPSGRIRVTLESTNSGSRTTFADDNGVFNFNSLESGPYQLTVDAGNQFEVARESVYIEGAKPIYNVPVYLRLRPEANPALAGVPPPALDLYHKGLESARKGDSGKAVEQFGEAVKLHPRFGLAHGELGMLYLKANQLDKAHDALRSARAALPDDPTVQLNYAVVLLEKKEYAGAEEQLRGALKKMDGSAPAHMYLGIALMRQNSLDEAERELVRATKLGGASVGRAHYYLGGIYWGRKEYKRAADALETYLKLTPKAPDAERLRATIRDLRGKG